MGLTHRLLSGTTKLTLGQLVARLAAVAALPILTGVLTPAAYGMAALASTSISLASVIALAGVDMSYARTFYGATGPSGAVVEHYCWRFALSTAITAATIAGLAWAYACHVHDNVSPALPTLVAVGTLLTVVQTMAQTRARLSNKYDDLCRSIVISGLLVPVATLGIALLWRDDAVAIILSMTLGYLMSVSVVGVPPIRSLLARSKLSTKDQICLINTGLAGIVTAPMYWVVSSADRWFLQTFHGPGAVGTYSIAYGVGAIGLVVNSAVIAVWIPEASKEFEQNRERARQSLGLLVSRLGVGLALVWMMVASLGPDMMRCLTNVRFHQSAPIVPYIAAGVFFYGVFHLASIGLLLAKKLYWSAVWWICGGLVCVSLNFALVPEYGGIGAAAAQALSFALIAVGAAATSQAILRLTVRWSTLLGSVALVILVQIALQGAWHVRPIFSVLEKLPIALMVCFSLAWFVAPDWCQKGFRMLRQATRLQDT
jgi:O-antigen/teichoic acid export membrane protein